MRNIFILLSLIITINSCKKDDTVDVRKRTCNSTGTGTFSANINNQAWSACEFNATYYSNQKLLALKAIDENSNIELRFLITLDTVTPLKTYTIGPNENCGVEIVESINNSDTSAGWDRYLCDLSLPNNGGSFTITELDTVSNKLSAHFTVKGYSPDRHITIDLNNGTLTNVKLNKSDFSYGDNYMSANINGTNWYSNSVYAKINSYIGSTAIQFLEIRAEGYFVAPDGNYYEGVFARDVFNADGRHLTFVVPIALGNGTFPLEPSNSFVQTWNSQHHLFNYNNHNNDNLYYPITGSTVSISNMDIINRSLDAVFNTQAKDSTGQVINFTTGKIHIERWQPF